ncbi:P27 family phage terminase small subunit [Granulibacter bethesdensis]|uniref:P27 family phage terminase small subunit n=1 Tax=Granulibacter bethesdensis TaxID=364410 RepID=UPI00046CC643|nr:P27 family phage terminase small subunit [Granulibacter bethesdensis]
MEIVDDTGGIVAEPRWTELLTDGLEIAAAHEYWRIVITEMRERGILAASNGHAVQRLILAYLLHDRAARIVTEEGLVLKPKRGSPRAITRLSPHFSALREIAADAAALEAELGLSPRRRTSAARIEKKIRSTRASDAYLRPFAR